ncbi:phenylacetate-coenzyme A ligase [Halorhodospira halochloris]|uniref:Phenylacetate-coenzyme A ligase n=1 Tax=Halorhodospira halochloris TaxID=1052 RepID=A0A110B5E5_HALHR|nr:phenylacetate--CoA ligase [Halorhodospira halochloris]BAU57402.1 phenylacetate-coenzyme A ligase [Halorhodospira halochloris]
MLERRMDNSTKQAFNVASAPDYLPLPQLRALQLDRLRAIVKRTYERVSLFRQRCDERGIKPDDIRQLEDIRHLPFTVKNDLRETYPYGLFASPMEEIVRLHASSGTTGKPIVVAYTESDIALWAHVMERSFAACGVHPGDIVQNAYGYGLFTGGLGAHYGAEALGATVIPISGGQSDRQIMVMRDFGVTALCCTPSYFLHLLERADDLEVDWQNLPLRVGIFGAEPWTDNMRQRIEQQSGIRAFDIYGLSEIIGPGVGVECTEQDGPHIFEDHFYPEVIDPESGEVLADGEEGELVLTTLTKQAMPMIRYRTRDITSIHTATCACGRTVRRIKRIGRRSDDMLIIRGVNVFPSQIETALLQVEGTMPHYQIELSREQGLDQLEVAVEVNQDILSDTVRGMEELHQRIAQAIERIIGVRATVRLVEPQTLPRSEGKAKRVIDRREQ